MVKEKTLKSRNFNAIYFWEHSGFTALRENLENQGKIWKIRENSGKIFKIYSVILRILSKYRKIRTRKNSNPSSNQGKTLFSFELREKVLENEKNPRKSCCEFSLKSRRISSDLLIFFKFLKNDKILFISPQNFSFHGLEKEW